MSDTVREALSELEPGAEVELELTDGRKVSGTVEAVDDGEVRLEGEEDTVSADDVSDVVEMISSEGPE